MTSPTFAGNDQTTDFYIDYASPLQLLSWSRRIQTTYAGSVTEEAIQTDAHGRPLTYAFRRDGVQEEKWVFNRKRGGKLKNIKTESNEVPIHEVRVAHGKENTSVATSYGESSTEPLFEFRLTRDQKGRLTTIATRKLFGDPQPAEIRLSWKDGRISVVRMSTLKPKPVCHKEYRFFYSNQGAPLRMEMHLEGRLFEVTHFGTDARGRLVSDRVVRDGKQMSTARYTQ